VIVGAGQKERVLVFFLYAQRDRMLREELEQHLYILKYRGLIEMWDACELHAGDDIYQQIATHLEKAQVILFLVSVSLVASGLFESNNMRRMWQRQAKGDVTVIPILLRSTYIAGLPFADLAMLPTNQKPVAEWRHRDRAFVDIAIGIERVVYRYMARQGSGTIRGATPESVVIPHPTLRDGGTSGGYGGFPGGQLAETRTDAYYEQALDTYQRALIINSTDSQAYQGTGHALYALERYEEAFEAFARAAQLHPIPANAVSKGKALAQLERYEEALNAYHEALDLDPDYAAAYYEISDALVLLGRTIEAQEVYKRAMQLGYEE
jgi:tetratricopeptide (TPR) repeat protein